MSLQEEIDRVCELADRVAASLAYELVDVRFGQSGKKRSLEVTIYRRQTPIALEDCEVFSRALEKELDEASPPVLGGAYLLEVQSPGIDRQLKTERELSVFLGHTVEAVAREAVEPFGNSFMGTLLSSDKGRVTLGNLKPLPKVAAGGARARAKAKQAQAVIAPPERLEIEMSKLVRLKLYPTIS
jgi:ribosome maturation factor RimP